LLSAAWFERIDAAIAHQSGTLGASQLTDDKGEPLSALLSSYPHWPNAKAQRYADTPNALPVQPRDLLALIADKPVLLGNAKRDVWSDPFGAYVEARAAWPETFDAASPGDFQPASRHAFWQRPGTHGVNKEDWEAFLTWLEAQDWAE
ncbi:MAG: alpha/beta hydrolase, partial [Pseudomonadota bacterium]